MEDVITQWAFDVIENFIPPGFRNQNTPRFSFWPKYQLEKFWSLLAMCEIKMIYLDPRAIRMQCYTCYGKNAHSVGGADWREEMARALVQWLLLCSKRPSLRWFRFWSSCGRSGEAVTFWEDSGKEQKIVLNRSILVCLAPATAYLHWP